MATISEGIWLESSALGIEPMAVQSLEGFDELNRIYRFGLHLELPAGSLAPDELSRILESPATIVFVEREHELNRFSGIISELSARPDVEHTQVALDLELVPRLWLLRQQRGSEIFLGRSVPEVVSDKLIANGLVPGRDFSFALREDYAIREFIAQYEETDLDFIDRLCEHAGIIRMFEQRDGAEAIVFTDQQRLFRDVQRSGIKVRHRADHPAAWSVQTKLQRLPRELQAHDYNYRTPRLGLRETEPSRRPVANGGWTEFGGHAKTVAETKREATVRAEEWGARQHVVEAHSSEASLRAGGVVHLTDALLSQQDLVMTRVDFVFEGDRGGGQQHGWLNRISAIPQGTPFRPARVTPVPRVPGLMNAVVDGEIRGDYAELDDHGRYHLRMAYDRSGRTDLGATHPVRMMQPHAGAHYGMHFPLRPGTEVLVGFVNADPDRPVIVGTAPNPVTTSPVVQLNQTQNVLRTGSNNEMVIEDLKGIERIRLHTPYKTTTLQLGSVEEPEEGVFVTTEANVSTAARGSHNVMTERHTTVAESSTAMLGKSAVILAGMIGVTAGSERGFDKPSSLSLRQLESDLQRISRSPADRTEEDRAAPSALPESDEPDGGDGGLQSGVSEQAAVRADDSALALVRAASEQTDLGLDSARGRAQGEALGEPLDPSAIIASDRTAAVIGRDIALVFGDRCAALSSHDTASVMGRCVTQLKSPGTVEVAAGKQLDITTAGELDVAAKTARIVAGYYPEAEAPPLDDGVSLGIMARRDLRVHSVEDCILVCAKKNLIGSAHSGDVRLTAQKTVALKGGAIVGSAGSISLDAKTIKAKASGDIEVTAGGDVKVKAANVTIEAGTIRLVGTVLVEGDLFVSGDSNL